MKAGDLVKTTRSRIGLPIGTLGLIVGVQQANSLDPELNNDIMYYLVMPCSSNSLSSGNFRRHLSCDLEVISESR